MSLPRDRSRVSIAAGAAVQHHRARTRRLMGAFRVDIELCRPGRRARWVRVRHILVDSGSEMTWLPEPLLRAIGIDVFKRDQRFVMANGLEITRDVGFAVIRSGDFKTVDEVVFGRTGDLALLGAHTQEGFNASVDLRRKRLVPSGPIPAARATQSTAAAVVASESSPEDP